ncbi:hypothetical protein [Roseibium sp.]|uniref:hypothetical protein n=1 Tax=Roseibium sp. TaxID=1936156 RepID=UPI003D0EA2D5
MVPKSFVLLFLVSSVLAVEPGFAGDVEIVGATARENGGNWTISVTLRHADTGWNHYADLWQIQTPEGYVLGERVLLHPHVDEQPFTRSLSGVEIPRDLENVIIRARDNLHGFSLETYQLALPR